MDVFKEFLNNITVGLSITDFIDVAIVAFIIYKVLEFIKDSRAEQLVKGLVVILVVALLSGLLNLYTLNWIIKTCLTMGIVALVVIFQPELRRGLEHMGRSKIIKPAIGNMDEEKVRMIIGEFLTAVEDMSNERTGALIVFERQTALTDIAETGVLVNADITAPLIENIFYEGSPLHDGAMVVSGDEIVAAGCVLPLTEKRDLPKGLGTRHRAGIGITERSDCMTIIVSEETGYISIVEEGIISRGVSISDVNKALSRIYVVDKKRSLFGSWGSNKKDPTAKESKKDSAKKDIKETAKEGNNGDQADQINRELIIERKTIQNEKLEKGKIERERAKQIELENERNAKELESWGLDGDEERGDE